MVVVDDDDASKETATEASTWDNNYLTPPRRRNNNGKRQRPMEKSSTTVSPFVAPLASTDEDDDDDDAVISSAVSDVELQTPEREQEETTTTTTSSENNMRRTGLFRRLRNRRLLRVNVLAPLAPPSLVPVSPPVSGNSQYSVTTAPRSARRAPRRGLIPADHPLKLLWDVLTVLLSIANAYMTHIAIRDRKFDAGSIFKTFTEVWLVIDILLNFVTERTVGNVTTLRTISAVSARYLTTWFVVDVLSLVPGEVLFVKPVIEQQNARRFLKKWALRTRAVTRVVTRLLRRWTYVRSVAKHSHHVGGVARVTKLSIKYIPKYFLFVKHMKAVIGFRLLRQYHWMRRLTKKHETIDDKNSTTATTDTDDDDDTWPDELEYYYENDALHDDHVPETERQQQQQELVVFEYDEFDDGDPY